MPQPPSSRFSFLPEHLAERTRRHPLSTADDSAPGGGFVLYWMRTAVRDHENPALDVALLQGQRLGLPVFVYHALSERYPYASDRHHRFVLEGARDVQVALRKRGVGTAFHLEREGQRGPHLRSLAQRAALVVTEDMPVRPLDRWASALAGSLKKVAVDLVDTACLVPMRLVGRAHDRAFAYRDATREHRERALARDVWPEVDVRDDAFVPDDLPFDPIELAEADLDALIADCAIDHTVGPVPHTVGGSVAGYARWDAFVNSGGLKRYDRTRNDPLRDGVSRMSAYLHYGHVSPFRLARDAQRVGGGGGEKYLDELLVWRELAYAYCFYREDHDAYDALPQWAQDSFAAHERDPRPALYSQETLARARTDSAFWNAMQRSLLIHGELHNNVRMTWGKAFAQWTPDASRALALAVDLNHRYALDGRDPGSYGGLLWCFGAFDRPFKPEQEITGAVRGRPLAWHATRVDVERYAAKTGRPASHRPPRIAVIGAGVSGLACARALSDQGLDVVVFDKARGAGGRTSTRRVAEPAITFDHGAQYFTAKDPRFQHAVRSWHQDGVVRAWEGKVARIDADAAVHDTDPEHRYVGDPGMSAICRHLAADLRLHFGVRVARFERRGERWALHSEDGAVHENFDVVLSSAPAPQTETLFGAEGVAPDLAAAAARAAYAPCRAIMLGFEQRLDLPYDGAFVEGSTLSWVARDSSKPSRASGLDCWVLHAAPGWSAETFEDEDAGVIAAQLKAFCAAVGVDDLAPLHAQAHRWAFSLPTTVLDEDCLFDAELGLGACGDWCGGPRIEGAFLSGAALAGRVLAAAAAVPPPAPTAQGSLF